MIATLERMGKQKKTEPTVTVRVPESISKDLKRIVGHKDVEMPDYLAEILAPIIQRELEQMQRDLDNRLGKKSKRE